MSLLKSLASCTGWCCPKDDTIQFDMYEESQGLLAQEDAEAPNEFGEYVCAQQSDEFGIEHSVGDRNVRQWVSGLPVFQSSNWPGLSGWSWSSDWLKLFGNRHVDHAPVPAWDYTSRSASSGSLRSRQDLLGSEDEAPSAILDAEQLSDGFARELIFGNDRLGTSTISGSSRSGDRTASAVSEDS